MDRGQVPVLAGLLVASALLALACGTAAAEDAISVDFGFAPAQSAYCPGDCFSVEVTVVNQMPSGDYLYDSLAYMVKVTNVSVHFYWMAPNEWAWDDVSDNSSWLAPDGAGIETYPLNLTVPADASEQTYSYYFKVEYLVHTAWGNITYTWGTGITYRDFVVEAQEEPSADDDGTASFDYMPVVALLALVLSLGAIGAVMYRRGGRGAAAAVPAGAHAAATVDGEGTPALRPAPGEHVPVEMGFIYLVKEARPGVAFTMFNDAVSRGAEGMLISREHPNRLRELHEFDAKSVLWLTRRAGANHVDPTELSLVSLKVTRFVEERRRAVVLMEGAEYLITQNDFETVLRFVNHLHDFVLAHECAVVLVIDPRVLNIREMALLERSAKVVEPFEPAPAAAPPEAKEQAEA